MGRERSAFHRGPESFHSNEGRIHLRRPTLSFSFSLASRRRTIHVRIRRHLGAIRPDVSRNTSGQCVPSHRTLRYTCVKTPGGGDVTESTDHANYSGGLR